MQFPSRRMLAAIAMLILAPITSWGCSTVPAWVDQTRMLAANDEPGQWMGTGRTYDEQRFSPLTQINDQNIGELGLAWFADVETTRGMEATPLMIDGVLYNIEPWNITKAYDAKTGELLWTYDPKVPTQFGRKACCDIVSRGIAAWKGRIYIATLDGRLIAVDAKTGKPVWSTLTVDNDLPYTITGAPRVVEGKVLIGNGGAELGVRGYLSAYDAQTGDLIWRFHTVPGNPADGFENKAMEMAAKTWNGTWWKLGGGGTVWDSFVYDPQLNLVYIGVGNGSPWAYPHRSPGGGDNLFLTSIVAVRADTGEYVWHYQQVPGEQWDYTATQPMILADLEIEGSLRKVLMQAPKNGFFYVLDRETGELISAEKFVPVNWASAIDKETGRPVENPAARYGNVPQMVSPGAGGGHNWNPMAFSPVTGLAYFQVSETYMGYALAQDFDPDNPQGLGTSHAGYPELRREIAEYADAHSRAWLTAWDPVAQKEVWRVPYSINGSGGVLATAGNLVFQGTIDTTFAAYRADTGEKLWELPVQNVPISGPITYEIDGEQYVAVNAGWGGGLAHVERSKYTALTLATPRLLVFKLGGTAKLPPLSDATKAIAAPAPPPELTGTPAMVAQGETLYGKNCALCHGPSARGGIKDLRFMSAATHSEFADIVLGGKRAQNGMASFDDVLSPDQAEAIRQYVIFRANADWDGREN